MQRILKWNVLVDDEPHEIGSGRVIHVACQNSPDEVQVWTEEDAVGRPRMIPAQVYGTGHLFPANGVPVGSAVVMDGALVWHVVAFPQNMTHYGNIHAHKI